MFNFKLMSDIIGSDNKMKYLVTCLEKIHDGKSLFVVRELTTDYEDICYHDEATDTVENVCRVTVQSGKVRALNYYIPKDGYVKDVRLVISNNGHLRGSVITAYENWENKALVMGENGLLTPTTKNYDRVGGRTYLSSYQGVGCAKKYKYYCSGGEVFKRIQHMEYKKIINKSFCYEVFEGGGKNFRCNYKGKSYKHNNFHEQDRFMFALETGIPLMIPQHVINTAIRKKLFNKATGVYKTE